MNTRAIGVLAVVVTAAAAAVLLRARVPAQLPGHPVAVAPAAAPAASAAATTNTRQQCRFETGQRLSYSTSLETSTLQVAPGASKPATLKLRVDGRVDFEVLPAQPGAAVLAGRLSFTAPAGKSAFDVEALRTPFLVQVDAQCQLQNFARWSRAPLDAARNQQALLWDTQFRTAAGEFRIQDASGMAVGRLEPVAGGVHRTLERYESVWPGEPEGLTLYSVMGVDLGAGPWFEALTLRREVSSGPFSTSSSLSLARTAAAGSFSAEERLEASYVWANLLPKQPRPELVGRPFTQFDRTRQAKVADQSLPQALDGFVDRVKKGVGRQDRWPDLSAYFEVHPDAVKPAIARYLKGELPPEAAGDFFLALSKARTDEAREALLAFKRDDGAVMMDQVRAMFALVTREDVGHGLAVELSGDVRKQVARRNHDASFLAGEAMLALATMSGIRNDAAIAHTAKQALEGVLGSEAPSSPVVRVALRAIGNTGDPSMLPTVGPYTNSDDIDTRKAAAHAFSRMPPDVSDPLGVAWLKRETSPFVKKELYRVLQQQHLDLHQGASRALVEQTLADLPTVKSAYTRKSMVLLIAQSAVAKDPEIRRALVQQARRERARHTPLVNEFGTILTNAERAEVLR